MGVDAAKREPPRLAAEHWPELQGKQTLMSSFSTKRVAETLSPPTAPPNGHLLWRLLSVHWKRNFHRCPSNGGRRATCTERFTTTVRFKPTRYRNLGTPIPGCGIARSELGFSQTITGAPRVPQAPAYRHFYLRNGKTEETRSGANEALLFLRQATADHLYTRRGTNEAAVIRLVSAA